MLSGSDRHLKYSNEEFMAPPPRSWVQQRIKTRNKAAESKGLKNRQRGAYLLWECLGVCESGEGSGKKTYSQWLKGEGRRCAGIQREGKALLLGEPDVWIRTGSLQHSVFFYLSSLLSQKLVLQLMRSMWGIMEKLLLSWLRRKTWLSSSSGFECW